MEGHNKNLPRVLDDVMPPLDHPRASHPGMLLARAQPHVIRYTRVEQWEIVGAKRAASSFGSRTRLALATGAVLLVVITALSTWWLVTPPPPQKNVRVTVSLPAVDASPRATAQPTTLTPLQTQVAAIVAAPTAVAAEPEGRSSGTPHSEHAALARAFATNESWPWRGETTNGLVVVGPGEIVDGKLCRNVAIMTRGADIPTHTVNSRKCQEPGGNILEVVSPDQ